MMIRRKGDHVSVHSVILSSAAALVPSWCRAEWLADWRSELWYVLQRCNLAPHRFWWDREALLFCLGAFRDAMWLRRNGCSPNPRQRVWLQSPFHCLLLLAAVAGVAISYFFRSSGPYDTIVRTVQARQTILVADFLMIAIAVLVLPATTSLALGEYPTAAPSLARAKRFRRWIFLGTKFALILSIVFCGTLDLAPITILPQATLLGSVLAFRWVFIDQRRRCPVCLRLLANPARIGQPSQMFFGWYGTEYFCVKGHGLLYVPEIRTTYGTQRWLDLDSSCGGLFS